MNIKNLKIGLRLSLGFGMVLLLLVATAATGIWRLYGVGLAVDAMAERTLVKERIAAEWLVGTSTNSIRALALIKSDNAADEEYFQKGMAQTSLGITESSKKLFDLLDTAEEKALFEDSVTKRVIYVGLRNNVMKLKAQGQNAQATQLSEEKMLPALAAYDASIKSMLAYQKSMIDQSLVSIDALDRSGQHYLLALALLALGTLVAWRLTSGITRPLNQAVKIAQTVAAGDLTSQIDVSGRDETGQLMQEQAAGLSQVVGVFRLSQAAQPNRPAPHLVDVRAKPLPALPVSAAFNHRQAVEIAD